MAACALCWAAVPSGAINLAISSVVASRICITFMHLHETKSSLTLAQQSKQGNEESHERLCASSLESLDLRLNLDL